MQCASHPAVPALSWSLPVWLPSNSSPGGCVTTGCCTVRQRTWQRLSGLHPEYLPVCADSPGSNAAKLQSGADQILLYQRERLPPTSPWPPAPTFLFLQAALFPPQYQHHPLLPHVCQPGPALQCHPLPPLMLSRPQDKLLSIHTEVVLWQHQYPLTPPLYLSQIR